MAVSRRHLVPLLVGLLVASAGCGSVLTGDGPLEFGASDASIGAGALDTAGFEETRDQEVTLNRTVEVQDEERQLNISNHVAVYEMSSDDAEDVPVAVAVVSTPQANTLGVSLNPVGSMPLDEAISFATDAGAQFGGDVRDVERVDTWEATVLGEEREVAKFSGTVETESGETVDAYFHLVRVEHDDDIVLVAAAYPQALEDEGVVSREDLGPLFEGVEH